jgi:ribosomal protein S18 acetylase RimI-like enzyme
VPSFAFGSGAADRRPRFLRLESDPCGKREGTFVPAPQRKSRSASPVFTGTQMIVRPATPSDCHAIAALHARSWQSTYREILSNDYLDHHVADDRKDLWEARFTKFDQRQHHVAVAQSDDAIVGFVCVLLDEEPEYGALLDNLHVAPERQRGGVGRRLMTSAAHWVAAMQPDWAMHLWVYEQNTKTVAFYRSAGGTDVDRRVIVTPAGNRAAVLRFEWRDTAALARLLDASFEPRTD